ncbi:MAG: AraC family transcriptional regulator [Bacillota bacterium]|nr:AraC family transcriptional regulator [Bacillota bacterium]
MPESDARFKYKGMYNCFNPLVKCDESLPFYITNIGIYDNETLVLRPYGANTYQLLYTIKGHGIAIINGREYNLNPGDMLYIPPFAPHDYRKASAAAWETCWIVYEGYAADRFFDFDSNVWTMPDDMDFYNRFIDILLLEHDADWSRKGSLMLYSILLNCKECTGEGNLQIYQLKKQLQPVILYIEQNYQKKIELPFLANLSNMSEGHLCRQFKTYTNMRPFEYITSLRIQKAKSLIKAEPTLSISEIGRAVGFDNDSYFIMLFKKHEGLTPKDYKNLR